MRAVLLAVVIAACAPKVPAMPRPAEDDLDSPPRQAVTSESVPTSAPPAAAPTAAAPSRTVAAPGKGVRTGTIARAHLVAVLDAGPAVFLRQLEVAPHMAGDRFVGWRLVQLLDHTGPLHDIDVAPGDVLVAVNGKSVARPEQLQALWDSLRSANDVTAQLWRSGQPLELHFTVEPRLP